MQHRAVKVGTEYDNCLDILSAEEINQKKFSFPFALGIGEVKEADDFVTIKPISLIYVSRAAAAQRDPHVHENNGPGVISGWYAIVEPNSYMEIHVDRIFRHRPPGVPDSVDSLNVEVRVDGRTTDCSMHHEFGGSKEIGEQKIKGYMTEMSQNNKGKMSYIVQRFRLQKSNISPKQIFDEYEFMNVKVGCVEMLVTEWAFIIGTPTDSSSGEEYTSDSSSGEEYTPSGKRTKKETCRSKKRSGKKTRRASYKSWKANVLSEQGAKKFGRSVEVGGGKKTEGQSLYAPPDVERVGELHDANITVNLRERRWLQNRRIIDKDGAPIRHKLFQKLLQKNEFDLASPVSLTSAEDVKKEKVEISELVENELSENNGGKKPKKELSLVLMDLTSGNEPVVTELQPKPRKKVQVVDLTDD